MGQAALCVLVQDPAADKGSSNWTACMAASVEHHVEVQQADYAGWLRLAICKVQKAGCKHPGLLACNEAVPRYHDAEIAVDVNSIDRRPSRRRERMHFMPYRKAPNMG